MLSRLSENKHDSDINNDNEDDDSVNCNTSSSSVPKQHTTITALGAARYLEPRKALGILTHLEASWSGHVWGSEGWMGWRVGGLEGSRVGGVEGWRVGGLEGWRVGGLEGWRVGAARV